MKKVCGKASRNKRERKKYRNAKKKGIVERKHLTL